MMSAGGPLQQLSGGASAVIPTAPTRAKARQHDSLLLGGSAAGPFSKRAVDCDLAPGRDHCCKRQQVLSRRRSVVSRACKRSASDMQAAEAHCAALRARRA